MKICVAEYNKQQLEMSLKSSVTSPEPTDSAAAEEVKGTPTDFNNLYEDFKISLKQSFKENNVDQLRKTFDMYPFNNNPEKKIPLDQVFREYLLFELSEDIESVGKLISLSVLAAREEIVSVTMPVVLLADIFDAVTLDKCESIFKFVEDFVTTWKEEIFFASCKNNILRMCNDLLRRLSRAQNTVFCGRILLFLAKFFPFSERSGLNVISEFNLENLTEYEADGQDSDELLNDTVEDIPVKIDYNLYRKFWSLQDYFRSPNQCYNAEKWITFSNHTSTLLGAFSSFKLEEPRLSNKRKAEEDDDMAEVEMTIKNSENFFAKFLTNPKLLALQLSDSNFRRSVLLQFLILFQYLQSTVKFKTDTLTLTTAQLEFIKETETKIYKLIEETPPQGRKFCKTVQHMLKREEMWNSWKNDGCKEFKKPEIIEDTAKPVVKRKRSLGSCIKEAHRQGKFYLGNDSLTKLWNLSPDNLMACKSEDRNFLPSLAGYLESPKEKSDPSYEWRALRLLARQSPHFFSIFNGPTYKISDYLETVRKKLIKEKVEMKVDSNASAAIVEAQVEHETETETVESIEETPELSELIKVENDTEEHLTGEVDAEDQNRHKTSTATKENIEDISKTIGSEWKKLGKKLGYTVDELLFFETENADSVVGQCKAMLTIWFDDDDDASLDNLAYILEGLDMIPASEFVKAIIDPPNKMEDVSD